MTTRAPRYSPLHRDSDLSEAADATLAEQLRYEFWQVKEASGMKHEALAAMLGYESTASISRWLNGHDRLPAKCCKKLDSLGYSPTIGGSFEELHKAYTRARRNKGSRPLKTPQVWDVFLASPMASLEGSAFKNERKAARELKNVLENSLGYTVYYAGENIETQDEFDSSLTAAERNFAALRSSRYFLLLSVSRAEKPSSVTVEAGYALGQKIPSLYLVRNVEHLPFVLQSLGQHEYSELPRVTVEQVPSRPRAIGLIANHGEKLFSRLDDAVGREGMTKSRRRTRPGAAR